MEVFTCIAYCSSNQTLCAGTNHGKLFTWKKVTSSEINDASVQSNYTFEFMENAWQLHNISTVRGAIKHCAWGICDVNKPCVMLNCISNVYILKVKHSQSMLMVRNTRSMFFGLSGATIAFGTFTRHLADTEDGNTTCC